MPTGLQASDAAVVVTIRDEDVPRLEALVRAARVGDPGAGSFADLLSATLHRGIVESYAGARRDSPDESAGDHERRRAPHAPSPRRTSVQAVRRSAVVAAVAAAVIIIVGGYADGWTWTGLRANGQVWDWLQLLLLPVALGTFPVWLRFVGEMSAFRRRALGAAVLAFTGFVLAGYLVPLTWTGCRGRTLWSWLTLIALPLTVSAVAVWPKTGRRFPPVYRVVAACLGVAWLATVLGGYLGTGRGRAVPAARCGTG